jgi:cellulose synthase/poly-beta-1,6-N-acetylglucosamine synthase-like glycosyltransferase
MNQVSEAITSVFGIVLLTAIGYELRRRRKRLRELYNVLDHDDVAVIADLDTLLSEGSLKQYVPEFEFSEMVSR